MVLGPPGVSSGATPVLVDAREPVVVHTDRSCRPNPDQARAIARGEDNG